MNTKLEDKIIRCLLDRFNSGGLDAALEYGIAVCAGNPQITQAVLSSAPEPLKTMLGASFVVKESKQKIAHSLAAKRIGQGTVFLAGLTMAERALCDATKKEVDAAVDMRRNCVRSTKLKEILKCTETELKKWSTDGRLPVMFRRRIPSSVGVTLDVRHWDAALIQDALQHLDQWKSDDVLAKKRLTASRRAPSDHQH